MLESGPSIFVDVLLVVLYLLLAAMLGLTVWSVVHSMRRRSKEVQPTRMVSVRTTAIIAGSLPVGGV